jgi:MYXO-CTERM domain-containing protein
LFGVLQPPKPFTLSIFGAGLVGAVALRRRRKAVKKD